MKKIVHSYFVPTYTKMIVSHCRVLADLVSKYSLTGKVQTQESVEEPEQFAHTVLLSDEQFNNVLSGPYQDFFHVIFTAYGMIARIKRAHVMMEDDAFKGVSNKDVVHLKKLTAISMVEVDKLTKLLDQLIINLNEQLAVWMAEKVAVLIAKVKKTGVNLKPIELNEFQTEYPASELQDRFIGFAIDIPKLDPDQLDFSNYFYLKLYIAIYSSLSLEQKSNEAADVLAKLNLFKDVLADIRTETDKWQVEMQAQVDELMKPIAFVKDYKDDKPVEG